ncbi:serine/threonine protein kinase [Corallococcus sp. H22C18031201]|nr:serine/threonine protein kinase [Corallococcus sp. H22C18031201]
MRALTGLSGEGEYAPHPFSSPEPAPVADPNSLQPFGKYVLLSKIAAGGMAVTYRARLTGAAGVTKPCVIKQILPHFVDDTDFVEMFISEARVAAGLTHGNIAQVFDFGEVDGQYFIAMELVHGQPLSKVLRRAARAGMGFFPMPLALHIASKLCDGLDYAHRHVGEDGRALGLVHRDVSPDNVLISYEGEVKVIDFGIAKATSVVEAKTSPGTLKGKYPYFSPEQAQGRQDLDPRTDVYAAGVVLYEMVCGRRPLEGEFVTVLPRILTADYLPPSAVNPGVSPELETVIGHAMALDRESRYQTAQDLSESLSELLYRDNTRFSTAMLSQLMAFLFAEELAAEGRKVEISPSFRELLASWQSSAVEPSQGRAKLPSSAGSARPSSANIPRAPAAGGSRPPSAPGSRPGSDGGGNSVTSNASARRNTTSGMRRVTNPNIPRGENTGTGRRPLPPTPPELSVEPDTDSTLAKQPTAMPTLAAPRDTPVEVPAVMTETATASPAASTEVHAPPTVLRPPVGAKAHADNAREVIAREEAERNAQRQKQMRTLSLGIFGATITVLFVWLFWHFVIPHEGATQDPEVVTVLWITSKPEGATILLNGQERGRTPSKLVGGDVHAPHTLVLSLQGYQPWTKRFVPINSEVHLNADLQRLPSEPAATAPATTGAGDAGTAPQAVAQAATDGGTAPSDGGAAVAVAPAPADDGGTGDSLDGKNRDMYEVDYPTRLLVLRPMFNAMPVPEYATANIDVSPNAAYSVWTDGSAALADGEGTTSNTLVYFAEGDVPADNSFGLVGASPRTVKGAKRLHFFVLDENGPEDNRGSVRVHLRQSAYVPPRALVFDAEKNALQLKPEHQVILRGLNPRSTYLLTVRDDIAELHPGANGRVHQVLCVERGPTAESVRRSHRLFETGKRYQVTGAEDLRCTFPDTRASDNQGAIDVDIVDVTTMNRKQRAEALKGSSRSER